MFKEPPYIVKEAGYAGFILPIDIYFKNSRDDPKKVQFNYDLDLQAHKVQKEEHIITNPSEEFRRRLMKGGGQIVTGYNTMQPPPRHSSGAAEKSSSGEKKHKQKLSVEDSKFHELFGAPITKSSKVSQDPIIKPQTKTPPNNVVSGKLAAASHRASTSDAKKEKEKGDKDKSSKHKHASPNKEKDKQSTSSANSENPKNDKSHSKERDKTKDKDRSSSSSSSKRPGSSSPKRTLAATTVPPSLPHPPAIQTTTMVNSPKMHPNANPLPTAKTDEKAKSSSDKKSSKKEKKYDKGEKERDKKDREDKKKDKSVDKNATKEKTESKSNKIEKELPAALSAKDYLKDKKELAAPTPPPQPLPVPTTAVIQPPPNKKDKSEKEKDKEERKHKHKKKDKTKDKDKDKERSVSREKKEKKEKEKTKDASPIIKPARFEAKPIIHEPPAPPPQQSLQKSHPLNALIGEMSNGDSDDSEMDSPASIPVPVNDKHMDTDSSSSSEEVTNARPSSVASSNSRHVPVTPHAAMPSVIPEKSHHKNSKKEKKNDSKDEGKRRKRKIKESEEHQESYTPRSPPSPPSPHSSSAMEPPAKLTKHDDYFNENSSNNNNNKDEGSSTTTTTTASVINELPTSDYMSELKDLQHKIMTLQDNNELQRVVEMIAATGLYEITSATFDFDLCALDRFTVKKLQEFFATSQCT